MVSPSQRSLLGLEDKVALVTGAGRGIGKAATLLLAKAGAHVAAVDINGASAEETAGAARAIGVRAIAVAADVRSEDDVRGMVERAVAELGGLDVCVNNAGGTVGHPRVPFIEASTDFLDDALDLNLRAVFFACQVEARSMIERGIGGSIINISSLGGVRHVRHVSAYGAAKAGVINLTQTMAVELGPYGIRTNAIAPGTTVTGAVAAESRAMQAVARANPLGRLGEPDDQAGAILFLASDLSRYVNGQLISVDGGFTAAVGVVPRNRRAAAGIRNEGEGTAQH